MPKFEGGSLTVKKVWNAVRDKNCKHGKYVFWYLTRKQQQFSLYRIYIIITDIINTNILIWNCVFFTIKKCKYKKKYEFCLFFLLSCFSWIYPQRQALTHLSLIALSSRLNFLHFDLQSNWFELKKSNHRLGTRITSNIIFFFNSWWLNF